VQGLALAKADIDSTVEQITDERQAPLGKVDADLVAVAPIELDLEQAEGRTSRKDATSGVPLGRAFWRSGANLPRVLRIGLQGCFDHEVVLLWRGADGQIALREIASLERTREKSVSSCVLRREQQARGLGVQAVDQSRLGGAVADARELGVPRQQGAGEGIARVLESGTGRHVGRLVDDQIVIRLPADSKRDLGSRTGRRWQ
jgi:hypothetical protein